MRNAVKRLVFQGKTAFSGLEFSLSESKFLQIFSRGGTAGGDSGSGSQEWLP